MLRHASSLAAAHAGVVGAIDIRRWLPWTQAQEDWSIPFSSDAGACDICTEDSAGEDRRILEFVGCVHRTDVVDWMRATPVLCIPRGMKLRHQVQPVVAARVGAIIDHRSSAIDSRAAMLAS